jgi:hypothetical protein
MNLKNFTIKAQQAVQRAQQIAMENESQTIEKSDSEAGIE